MGLGKTVQARCTLHVCCMRTARTLHARCIRTACGLHAHCTRTRTARTSLDCCGAQAVPESRRIFRFERSMEFGGAEALLLRQLCLHMAFPTEREGQAGGGTLLPAYLSGESRLMLENFPELGFFRDIVFLFKMLMVHIPHRPLGLHAARVHRVAARLHGVAARVLRIAACFAWGCSLCYAW